MIILIACVLTLLIEVPFLFICGYRGRYELVVILCANVVTNLTLNLLLMVLPVQAHSLTVYILEAIVVVSEYFIYSKAFYPSVKLFALTLAANCLSYSIGLLIF